MEKKKQSIIIISAMDKNRLIGQGDSLPWHIPEEYNLFLSYIKEQTVIMGRRSFEIFKKDMLTKRMVVVSSSLSSEKASVFPTLNEAIDYSKNFPEDIYICGGSSVYKESIALADYMYLSYVKGEYEGTVFFPEFNKDNWTVEQRRDHKEFEFIVYKKKR
jgi:dihydrofolate reductase